MSGVDIVHPIQQVRPARPLDKGYYTTILFKNITTLVYSTFREACPQLPKRRFKLPGSFWWYMELGFGAVATLPLFRRAAGANVPQRMNGCSERAIGPAIDCWAALLQFFGDLG